MNWNGQRGRRSIASAVIGISKTPEPNEKTVQFYANLLEFLEEKGLETQYFVKAQNKQTIWSRINGMKTVLRKRGLDKEFFDRYYGGKDE